MKLKNGEIYAMREPLQQLMKVRLPIKTAFRLAEISSKLNEKFIPIEEARNKLIMQHGEEVKKGSGQYVIKQDSAPYGQFMAEVTELFGIEVDVFVNRVKLPALVDGKELEIEPGILAPLLKVIDVDEN